VEIRFSRHAKRRGKLYRISESTVLEILEGRELTQGKHEIIQNIEGFTYPLKEALAKGVARASRP